jgi:hypothetical protein
MSSAQIPRPAKVIVCEIFLTFGVEIRLDMISLSTGSGLRMPKMKQKTGGRDATSAVFVSLRSNT